MPHPALRRFFPGLLVAAALADLAGLAGPGFAQGGLEQMRERLFRFDAVPVGHAVAEAELGSLRKAAAALDISRRPESCVALPLMIFD